MEAFDTDDPFADRADATIDFHDPGGLREAPLIEDSHPPNPPLGDNDVDDLSGSSTHSGSNASFGSSESGSDPFLPYENELISDEESSDFSDGESDDGSFGDGYSFADQRRPRLTRLQLNWNSSFRECCNQFDMFARDWNEEFQCLYEAAEHGDGWDLAPKRRLQNLLNDFDELTRGLVKKLVDKGLPGSSCDEGNLNGHHGIAGTGIFPIPDIGLVPIRAPTRLRRAEPLFPQEPGHTSSKGGGLRLEDVKTVSQLRRWRKERLAKRGDSLGDGRRRRIRSPNGFQGFADIRDPHLHRCFRAGNIFLQKWITDREVVCARGIQASFRAIFVSRTESISFPLCALHTYRGITFTAMGLVPLGKNAKVVHRAEVQPDVPLFAAVHQLVRCAGLSCNVMPYDVGLRQLKMAGVEVVEAPDTRLYCLNGFGVLPPLFDEVGAATKRRLEHVVKSPMLAAFMHSPDHAYEKSCEQVSKLLPKLVRSILFSPEDAVQVLSSYQAAEHADALATGKSAPQTGAGNQPSARVLYSLAQVQLVKLMHGLGVNLCLMGEVLRCLLDNDKVEGEIREAAITVLCIEMVARTAKRFFYRELHRSVIFSRASEGQTSADSDGDYGNANLLHILSRLVGVLFPKVDSNCSEMTWGSSTLFVDSFINELGRKFGFEISIDRTIGLLIRRRLTAGEIRSRIIRRICELCGITLASGSIQRVCHLSSQHNYSVTYAFLSRGEFTSQIMDTSQDSLTSTEHLMTYVLPNRVRFYCGSGDLNAALRDAQRLLSSCQRAASHNHSFRTQPSTMGSGKFADDISKLSIVSNGMDIQVVQCLIRVASILGEMRRFDEAFGLLDDAVRNISELNRRSEDIAMVTSGEAAQKGHRSPFRICLFTRYLIVLRNAQGRLMYGKAEFQKSKGYFTEGLRIVKDKLPKEALTFASSLILQGLQGLLDIAQAPIGSMIVDIKRLHNEMVVPFLSKMRPSTQTHALLEQVGSALLHAGELLPASECLGLASDQSRQIFGVDSQEYATDLNLWAFTLMRADIHRFGQRAEVLLNQAMSIIEKISGPFSVNHLTAVNNLGALQIALGKYARASRLLNEAYSFCRGSTRLSPGQGEGIVRSALLWDGLEIGINSARKTLLPPSVGISKETVTIDHPVAVQIAGNLDLLRKNFAKEAVRLIATAWQGRRARQLRREHLLCVSSKIQRIGRGFIRREALRAELSVRERFPFSFGLSSGLLLASKKFVSKNGQMKRNWNSDLQHLLGNVGSYSCYHDEGFQSRQMALEKLNSEFCDASLALINTLEKSATHADVRYVGQSSHIICEDNIVLTRLGSDFMAEHMACLITHLNRLIIHSEIPHISVPLTVTHRSKLTGLIYLCQAVIPVGGETDWIVRENTTDVSRALVGLPGIDYVETRRWQVTRYLPVDKWPVTSDLVLTVLKHIFTFFNCGTDMVMARFGERGLCAPKPNRGFDIGLAKPWLVGGSTVDELCFLKCVGAIEVIRGADERFYLTNPLGLMPQWWRSFGDHQHFFTISMFNGRRTVSHVPMGIILPPKPLDASQSSAQLCDRVLFQVGVVSSVASWNGNTSGVLCRTPFSILRFMARDGNVAGAQKLLEEWLRAVPELSGWEVNGEFLILQSILGELRLEGGQLKEGLGIMRRMAGVLTGKRLTMGIAVRSLDCVGRACIREKQYESARQVYLDGVSICDAMFMRHQPTHCADLILMPLVGLMQCSETDGRSMFASPLAKFHQGRQLTSILTDTKLFNTLRMIRRRSWLSSRIVAIFHEFTKFFLRQRQFKVAGGIALETREAACSFHGGDSLQHVKALTTESQIFFSWEPKVSGFAENCRIPLEAAVDILERVAPHSQQLGSILNNLGFLLVQQRKWTAARCRYAAAEEVLRRCLEEGAPSQMGLREISKIRRNMIVVNTRITLQCVLKIQSTVRGWIARRRRAESASDASPNQTFQSLLQQEKERLVAIEERDRMLEIAKCEVELERIRSKELNERSGLLKVVWEKVFVEKTRRWLRTVAHQNLHKRDLWWLSEVEQGLMRCRIEEASSVSRVPIAFSFVGSSEAMERRIIEAAHAQMFSTGLILVGHKRNFPAAARASSLVLIAQRLAVATDLRHRCLRMYRKSLDMQEELNRSVILGIEIFQFSRILSDLDSVAAAQTQQFFSNVKDEESRRGNSSVVGRQVSPALGDGEITSAAPKGFVPPTQPAGDHRFVRKNLQQDADVPMVQTQPLMTEALRVVIPSDEMTLEHCTRFDTCF